MNASKLAIVIGAGIGGLTAATALADHFERVVVLERDVLPHDAAARAGTPQARHLHVLLAGGLEALEALFPGFEQDIARAGAVPFRAGLGLRVERPGFDPFPQRDLGFNAWSMTRPLLEHCARQRVLQRPDIELRDGCRVLEIVAAPDGSAATGVRWEPAAGGPASTLDADLVVDASGRGSFCLALLAATGRAAPPETLVEVDVGYTSALFAMPDEPPTDWTGLMYLPQAPARSGGAFVMPVEGRRWMIGFGGRGDEKPPGDIDGLIAFTRQFRMPTAHDAVCSGRLESEPVRYNFVSSVWRHYSRLQDFPRGLLPFADAICRFNPLYGQGMTVAAREACALRSLLATRAASGADAPDGLDGLAQAFFTEADALIDTPWAMSVLPDLMYAQTVGQRPPDLEATLKFSMALTALAAADPEVHKLMVQVQHMLVPRSALRAPALVARVMAEGARGRTL